MVALLTVLSMISGVHAQTRRIAHRSHGGTANETYDHTDRSYGEIDPFVSRVTWVMVVRNDSIVWKLDTLYTMQGSAYPVMPLQYHPILNVGDFGHICKKQTK